MTPDIAIVAAARTAVAGFGGGRERQDRAAGSAPAGRPSSSTCSRSPQACAAHQERGRDTGKVKVDGGAIAIGHPIAASACRMLVTLVHEMIERDANRGIAGLCIGGGRRVALTVER